MISYFQAVVIGLLQGVTELFPVSGLGHSVLLPALLGWQLRLCGRFRRLAARGPDHLDTARSLSSLASVLRAQGDLDGPATLHERALAIREQRLGPDHPDTQRSRRTCGDGCVVGESPVGSLTVYGAIVTF